MEPGGKFWWLGTRQGGLRSVRRRCMTMREPDRFFKHDAFISYARADNEKGAVHALHAQLDEFLRSSLPWEPSVWLDERSLNTEGDVKQQIREGLRDAAVLISITSETVESRKWCRDEMGWFLTGADLDRVIVERLYPVFLPFSDPARLPRWSKDLFTLDMFILDPERQELFAQQDYDAHRRYWDRLYGWMSKVSKGIIDVHAAWNLWLRP
jgi:hypothetical protein